MITRKAGKRVTSAEQDKGDAKQQEIQSNMKIDQKPCERAGEFERDAENI